MSSPEPKRPSLLQAACAALALSLLGTGFAAGLYFSFTTEGTPPDLAVSARPAIQKLLKARQAEAAIAELRVEALLQADPSSLRVLRELAEGSGDIENELLALRKLAQISPSRANPRIRLANRILDLAIRGEALPAGAIQEANTALRRAVALEPGSADAHESLARALVMQRDREGAIRHLRLALAAAPGRESVRNALAQLSPSETPGS